MPDQTMGYTFDQKRKVSSAGTLTAGRSVVSTAAKLGISTSNDECPRFPAEAALTWLTRACHSLMFRPRSYMAFAITPQPPIVDWLSELDASLERSDGFFAGQHVALDLSAVNLSSSAIGQLVANLEERNIRVLGIEGVDPAKWQPGLPPVLRSDRALRTSESPQFVGSAAPTTSGRSPAHRKSSSQRR